jgi:hypothetical protein
MTLFPIRLLLLVSLGANAGLALKLWLPTSSSPAGPSSAAMQIAARSARSPGETAPFSSRRAVTSDADRALILEAAARYGRTPALGDPRALAEKMFREGYPRDVVRSVVTPVLSEWMGEEAMSQAAREGSASARQLQRAIQIGGGPGQRYFEDLFSSDPGSDKRRERQLRFGDLPQGKVLEIERLEEELKWGINQGTPSPWDGPKTEAKMNMALSAFLSPDELADYWRFNSTVARHLQSLVRNVTIDEPTYDRLLAAANAFHQASGGREVFELQHLRGRVSDPDLAQLISRSGSSRESGPDKIYREAGLSESQRVEFHSLAAKVFKGDLSGRNPENAQVVLDKIRDALAPAPDSVAAFDASPLAKDLRRAAERK